MNERLVTFTFTAEAQEAADGVHQLKCPQGLDIVYVSVVAEAFSGAPDGFSIDIQDDGADVITAIAANTPGTVGAWCSKHFGGAHAPVHLAQGSIVDIDINLSNGSSPKADYSIMIWALVGEA
jgi:hypothetical protein